MLDSLRISNYVLIDQLEINLSKGLNMITGETGAGKSILLGALGLLIGQKADVHTLLNKEKKCVIEGIFQLENLPLHLLFDALDLDYEQECVIRREINPKGRSRAFINDSPVTLDVLKTVTNHLIDIHSQHQTLSIGNNDFQIDLIDDYGELTELRTDYLAVYATYQNAEKHLNQLVQEAKTLKENQDYQKFILEEILKLDPKKEEQEGLEQESQKLENALTIKENLFQAQNILSGEETSVALFLEEVLQALNRIASIHSNYQQLSERVQSTMIELNDIAEELHTELDQIEEDPQRLEEIKERLDETYRLQQKHLVSDNTGLIQKKQELEEAVFKTDHLDDLINKATLEKEKLEKKTRSLAEKLSKARSKCFAPLSNALTSICQSLGMPDTQLQIQREETGFNTKGIDKVELFFSANKGQAPVSLKKAASGGEFSRLMFAIKKIMAEKKALPTLIFDEIDTGISGEIALKMGRIMAEMGQQMQLITISHLPQIAAKGEKHFFVYKVNDGQKTTSQIKILNENDRIQEIAKMIGGENPSEAAFVNAKELINFK